MSSFSVGDCMSSLLALFKGGIARIIRSSPQFSVTLTTFELLVSLPHFMSSLC